MSVVVIQGVATGYSVVVPRQENGTTTTTASTEEAPNPILPVGAEMAWGIGSFLLLVLLMRAVQLAQPLQGLLFLLHGLR